MIRLLVTAVLAIVVVVALAGLVVLIYQGKRAPDTSGAYVALGSSFAAGVGLGPRQPGSPFVCMRSVNDYPRLLARMTGLSLVDMSCAGSTTQHILGGGRFFLGPQLAAVGPNARLVTITSGGNDVNYIGELVLAAGVFGPIGKLFWHGPKAVETRDFDQVARNLRLTVETIRQRAPEAKVVIVTYPAVLPENGTCDALRIDAATADVAREVAAKLREVTRAAAAQSGAILVDMATVADHDACSSAPWVGGAKPVTGAAFHPTAAGAQAIAEAVFKAITTSNTSNTLNAPNAPNG